MPGIILDILLLAMVLLSIAVVEEKNLVNAIVKYAFLSLAFVLVLTFLRAPDVALSAIVVGAVVIGAFLFTIREVEK